MTINKSMVSCIYLVMVLWLNYLFFDLTWIFRLHNNHITPWMPHAATVTIRAPSFFFIVVRSKFAETDAEIREK